MPASRRTYSEYPITNTIQKEDCPKEEVHERTMRLTPPGTVCGATQSEPGVCHTSVNAAEHGANVARPWIHTRL